MVHRGPSPEPAAHSGEPQGGARGPYRLPPRGYQDMPPGDPPLLPPRGGSDYPRLPRIRRRRRPRKLLNRLVLLVACYVLLLVGMPAYAWTRVTQVPADPTGSRAADGSGVNYLIVGSDSRAGLSKEEQDALGTGHDAGQRTDTIMVLHVPTFGSPTMISVPRDSYVPIPGDHKRRDKINAAYALGGPKLLAKTLEDATGLRIDGFVEIGFGGFVGVVDALNGVRMCLPGPIKDAKAHIDLPSGCQNLRGRNALGYVRARHFDKNGDLGRVERQRQFMSAVIRKTLTGPTILNPVRYARVGTAYGDALTIGESTGVFGVTRFGVAMLAVSAGRGTTLTVPVSDPFTRHRSVRPSSGIRRGPGSCSLPCETVVPSLRRRRPSTAAEGSSERLRGR